MQQQQFQQSSQTQGFGLPPQPQQQNTAQYNFDNVKQPPTSYGVGSRAGQRPLGTAARTQTNNERPMTSITAVKYPGANQQFDPLGQGVNTAIDLNKRPENTPEEQFKQVEKEINKLIEESSVAAVLGNYAEGLEKAKEAAVKEKNLTRQKEQQNLQDQINLELMYCVSFNLAVHYQNNDMNQEALQKYNEIIKSKQFPQAGRLRVNMGNIYFMQKKYSLAIKMYRMALDIIPASSKEMRFKILKNIGYAFVKLGQFHEAISSYEVIMKGGADFQTAFNLLLCLYALGDVQKMKECFAQLLMIEIPGAMESDEDELMKQEGQTQTDKLKEDIKEKKKEAIRYIVNSAKLIAPVIENGDIIAGYEYILETLKVLNYPDVEAEIEICKGMAYLKKKNIEKAIEAMKSFEKKDKKMMAKTASNISFLYFLEGDYKNAEKYADIAINYDRYNAKALVNRGNCLYVRNEFLRAKEQYLEAIGVEADCVEALYNLAFVNKKLNMYVEALQALEKLQTIVSSLPEVLYQIANIHELMGNTKQALKWYQILQTKAPSDPTVLATIGSIYAREDDENQALHYFSESYRYLPVNLETISWLGIYYVKHDLYERACHFFERAAQIQPREIKWKLMVASCYRRMGNFSKALKLYEDINQESPNNLECLRFLVQLCKEMGQPYDEYAATLRKLERDQEPIGFNSTLDDMYNQQDDGGNQDDYKNEPENITINVDKQPKQKIKQKQKNEDEGFDDTDVNALLE